ncbi:diaminopimelate decarboxylase [Plantactinospora sp. BB1]|uniref:diaminopimelate decarboxylase n=1 Tax=Plantactinospora sp. BB1 TaxID=2071627 RepID=UPI000D161A18|nr:diaminopimelate decarboxylase [Plantactinospora sp. BB1]AVT38311.1 diaminopimelate decarboxylase [Plantactinospora sp. BB1]
MSDPRHAVSDPIEQLKFLRVEEVRDIAERYGTPVFVYDEGSMVAAARSLAALSSPYGLTVRYSVKSCPTRAVIRIFDRLGLDFDTSSVWEALRVVGAGVPAERILLTAQEAVFDDRLRGLIEAGLRFDAGSLRQLDQYGRAFPGGAVSVRLNPGFGSGLVNRLTSGGPNSSFGIWHEDLGEVKRLVERHSLRLVRLHSHIGSGHHWDVLINAARALLAAARQFPDVEVIDLGGGYRVKSLLGDPEYDHREWAEVLGADLRAFAEETGRRLRVELEPGTAIMANSGSLVTRVVDVVSTGADGHRFVKTDGGLTEIVRPSYYGAVHPLVSVPASGPLRDDRERYCVVGHCCIAGDLLTPAPGSVEELAPVPLARTQPGDLLVVERAGGYASSMSMKNFNSFPEAPEVLRRTDGSVHLIRERQTLDQIIANERVPAGL